MLTLLRLLFKAGIAVMLLMACLSAGASNASETTGKEIPDVETLKQQGKLVVEAWIDNEETPAPSQQLLLNVRARTQLSFSQASHVGQFTVRDAAVLRRMTYPVKEPISLASALWQSQTWQLELYPNSEGVFVVPSIPVDMTVYLGKGQSTAGTLYTSPLAFEVISPEGAPEKGQWFAASEVALSEQVVLIRAGSSELQAITSEDEIGSIAPGDSVVRTLSLSGLRTASMLLPPLGTAAVLNADHFPTKPVLTNEISNGVNLANRIEKHTYLLNQSGQVHMPAISLWVFDTESQSWRHLQLPEHRLKVSGIPWQQWINDYGLFSLALLLALLALYRPLWALVNLVMGLVMGLHQQRTKAQRFHQSLAQADYLQALDALYDQLAEANTIQQVPRRTLRELDPSPAWQDRLNQLLGFMFSEPGLSTNKAVHVQSRPAKAGWLNLWQDLRIKLRPQTFPKWKLSPAALAYWRQRFSALPKQINDSPHGSRR